MRKIKKGSTDRSVIIRIIDSADGTPETGVVYNTAGIDLWYRREGAVVTSITEASLSAADSAHTDGGIIHLGNGYYRLDLPDAAWATGANHVMIGGTVTGMVVIGQEIQLVNYDPEDSVRLGLTALPNAAADAAGGLPISDAGALDLDAKLAHTEEVTAARMGALTDWIDGGRLDLLLDALLARLTAARAGYLDNLSAGAVALASGVTVTTNNDKTGYTASTVSDKTGYSLSASQTFDITGNLSGSVGSVTSGVTVTTNNDKTGYTASTVSDKTGYSLSVTPPTAAAIADAVWDETITTGHGGAGSSGITLVDALGYAQATRTALTDLRAANLDKIVGTIVAGTHNPQSGDAYGRIGINGAGLSALGDTRISFLDASILSRSSHSAADVWSVTTRTLSSFGSLVADIVSGVWGAVARTITGGTVSTVSDKTGYSISGTKQTLDALNDFNPASDTVARVTLADTCTTNTDMRGTDSALLASNYTVPPSVSSIADAVWDEATSGHSGAGTAGLALTSASAPTAEQVADAVWDESVSGHTTGGSTGAAIIAAGSAGDPWSTLIPGAYGAGTAGKIVGDNINATISSRSSHSAADVWAVSVRTLSSFGTLVADMAAAVWSTTTRTLSAFGFTVAPTVADIRTEIDSNSTQLIAIKAKTDQLTFTVAGHVDATASITGGGDATEAHQLDMIDKLKGLMSKAHVLTTAVGTFAPATDSNEAIRDRGDVAWNNGSINTMASTRAVISTDSSDAIIQDCAYKDISFKSGDDFEFDLDFPMDITAYTITAVVDGVSFTVTKKTTVRVGFSLTATQTATLRDNFPWSLTLVNAGKTRKYITGKYIKI